MAYPCQSYAYCLRHDVIINVKYNTFATAILWENINNDTHTLWVKCYNGISVRLRIPSVIVWTIPREWQSLVQLLGMGLTPPFLVITLRKVNTHFWRLCWGLTPPCGDVKKCQQSKNPTSTFISFAGSNTFLHKKIKFLVSIMW